MTGSSDPEASLLQRHRYLLTLFVAVGIWLFLMFAPASWCEKISDKRWELKGAWLFEGGRQDFLLVYMHSMGRHRGRSFTRFVAFDPADGRRLGAYLRDSSPKALGVDHQYLWLREFGVGVFQDKRDLALRLPALTQAYDLPALLEQKGITEEPTRQVNIDPQSGRAFILTGDRTWWVFDPDTGEFSPRGDRDLPFMNPVWGRKLCQHAPEPPRMIGERLLLDAFFACDMRTDELIDLGGGDRLLVHQTLQDEKGKLLLSRYQTSGQLDWTRREPDWCGEQRGREENGFRVEWSTGYRDRVLLVLPEDEATGELYLLSVDPGSGRIVWQERFD